MNWETLSSTETEINDGNQMLITSVFDAPTFASYKKGFKGDINSFQFVSSDYTKEELSSMGYSGASANIDDIDENLRLLSGLIGINKYKL